MVVCCAETRVSFLQTAISQGQTIKRRGHLRVSFVQTRVSPGQTIKWRRHLFVSFLQMHVSFVQTGVSAQQTRNFERLTWIGESAIPDYRRHKCDTRLTLPGPPPAPPRDTPAPSPSLATWWWCTCSIEGSVIDSRLAESEVFYRAYPSRFLPQNKRTSPLFFLGSYCVRWSISRRRSRFRSNRPRRRRGPIDRSHKRAKRWGRPAGPAAHSPRAFEFRCKTLCRRMSAADPL